MDKPKLLLNADGNVVLKDEKPVYKYSDGTEQPLDLSETIAGYENRINNLADEKTRFFDKAKEVETKLEAFGKLTPEIAKKNADMVKKIDASELIDKHGLENYQKTWTEEISTSMNDEWAVKENAWSEEKKRLDVEVEDMNHVIFDLAVKQNLATHPYFSGDERKTVYRPQDAAKIYGDRFKVERTGRAIKVHALDREGKVLLSKKNHGTPADFSEAVELIVQSDNDGAYDIFRGTKQGGPVIMGNTHQGGGAPEEGARSVDLIKAGLKKQQRAI